MRNWYLSVDWLKSEKFDYGKSLKLKEIYRLASVLVTCGYLNNLPHIRWFKTATIYSLTVWRPEV